MKNEQTLPAFRERRRDEAVQEIYSHGWVNSDFENTVRFLFVKGTLYIPAKDIDRLLGKAGHGHTLTGIPAAGRKKIKTHTHAALDDWRKAETVTAVKLPALQERIAKMRSLHTAEKEKVLAWLGWVQKPEVWRNGFMSRPEPNKTEWRSHHTQVTKTEYYGGGWIWDCNDCKTVSTHPEKDYSAAFEEAQRHSVKNAIHDPLGAKLAALR